MVDECEHSPYVSACMGTEASGICNEPWLPGSPRVRRLGFGWCSWPWILSLYHACAYVVQVSEVDIAIQSNFKKWLENQSAVSSGT